MHIPLIEKLGNDGAIITGPHEGRIRYYRTALLNTLIHLAPRVCLEIGTYYGGSAEVFRQYFDHWRPDGMLVTADIRILVNIEDERVHQAHVYPHIPNIFDHHSVEPHELLPDWQEHLADSVDVNCAILEQYGPYDFAFVDGDHTEVSVRKDLEIVRRLVKPPHYALFDDTHEDFHESGRLYREQLVHEYDTYEFEEFVGAALLWR